MHVSKYYIKPVRFQLSPLWITSNVSYMRYNGDV